MKMKKNKKKGFTLVELLAVIVILAIILVIAVPKIMSVIVDAKKATLESTAKMIASQAEKYKVQNQVLGNDKIITCKDITNINDIDYASCDVAFDNNTAKVSIEGLGKFEGLRICNGTKTSAVATKNSCPVNAVKYITKLLTKEETQNNGLVHTNVTYTDNNNEEVTIDAGIRYTGTSDIVKNKVYYNCDDIDGKGVAYGEDTYDYVSSCEIWRIIGVFDVENGNGKIEKRLKIINTNSIFKASWDSSRYISSTDSINYGCGINQWGESESYKGADLMQLLNGYYLGKVGAECKYCNETGRETCSQSCTAESLKNANMKVLTNTAKSMIDSAVWDTYAVEGLSSLPEVYLMEKGITYQYTGKNLCEGIGNVHCNDSVERRISWTGLVGLMSVYDVYSANGWLYSPSIDGKLLYPWTISPSANRGSANLVWYVGADKVVNWRATNQNGVWPVVYLKSNIQIIDGDGNTVPYKIK